MSITQARERMRDANVHAANAVITKAANDKTFAEIQTKITRLQMTASKTKLLIQRPGRIHLTSIAGISVSYIGTAETDAVKSAGKKAVPAAIELITSGATKISLAGEGTALSLRGLVQRSRYLEAGADRRIATARRAEEKARDAFYKAQKHHEAVITAEFLDAAKIEPDPIAAYVGERMALRIASDAVRRATPSYQIADEVEDAKKHLAHALAKSKDPCPCRECLGLRNRAGWDATNDRLAAERATKARAEAKILAAAPKHLFTCPKCGQDSISPVNEAGMIACYRQSRGYNDPLCGTFAITAIRTKHVTKAATIGLVAREESAA